MEGTNGHRVKGLFQLMLACANKTTSVGWTSVYRSIELYIKMIHRCIEGPLGVQRFWGHEKTMKTTVYIIYVDDPLVENHMASKPKDQQTSQHCLSQTLHGPQL